MSKKRNIGGQVIKIYKRNDQIRVTKVKTIAGMTEIFKVMIGMQQGSAFIFCLWYSVLLDNWGNKKWGSIKNYALWWCGNKIGIKVRGGGKVWEVEYSTRKEKMRIRKINTKNVVMSEIVQEK